MGEGNGVLTPTQKRMLAVLQDGEPHDPIELHECLEDELADMVNVRVHVSALRKRLRAAGRDVVSREGCYRLVRLIASGE